MTKISLRDFLMDFCDMHQIITVTIVDVDEKWCKFTGINSMPVYEVVYEEKFKDILEMNVYFTRVNEVLDERSELWIEVLEEEE
ncbi:hypothetical protein [Fibrobacter sp.]|uniref:hypothetical protein n=1 Tax=Fibrobacter sp. TaxID=35828 RepID=UPI00388DBD06